MSAEDLSQYQFQLEQVEETLEKDPDNEALQKLQADLKEIIGLLQLELSVQAAQQPSKSDSKSKKNAGGKPLSSHQPSHQQSEPDRARQELSAGAGNESEDFERDLDDLGDEGESDPTNYTAKWIQGQTVLAKYKDGKLYEAVVDSVPASGTVHYVVVFKGYTSKERVHIGDVRDFDPTQVAKPVAAVTGGVNTKKRPTPKTYAVAFGNGTDRRSKKKQRLLEHQEAVKAVESEHLKKQQAWKSFATGGKKSSLKTAPPLKKQSMFATPEDPNARVGVIGSGKPMTNFQQKGKHIYDTTNYANVDAVKIVHASFKLNVDFDRKVLHGNVTHTAEVVGEKADKIILDSNFLDIKKVSFEGQEVKYDIGEAHPAFGSSLTVKFPQTLSKGQKVKLSIDYSTTDKCTAAQWLEPAQTVGKQFPYMFTQCQPIHARSLAPVQDTPSAKFKYTAEITVPSHLRALMSAVPVKEETQNEFKKCFFTQDIAIPSYLLAMAVGNLAGRRVGPRSTVWSEPEVVDKAAWEFVDTEKFIATGMENPCITFATPSLIAGDRSMVDVVAHEIAHSWAGNLVTSATWEHFWLNEGFTVCIERKIMGRLHGEPERHFSAIIGHQALKESVAQFEATGKPEYTRLNPQLAGVDPDEVFSSVPYEKGFHLLFYLETILGGAVEFDKFLKYYVQQHSHKSITTDDFKATLYEFFSAKKDILDKVDWKAWFEGHGMPPVENHFDTSLANACEELANRWDSARSSPTTAGFAKEDVANFTSNQLVVLMEKLHNKAPLPIPALDLMDQLYNLSAAKNCDLRCRWLLVNLASSREAVYPNVVDLVTTMGRMKYVRPLYRYSRDVKMIMLMAVIRALAKAKNGLTLARETFTKFESFYHPICATLVKKDLFA
ncbi:Leukotriene A-4 hydrolase [Phlyctochytrium planicorne]|nr:Leukotriene A-4 hydrolase [Phlyctochytrium planicorne]